MAPSTVLYDDEMDFSGIFKFFFKFKWLIFVFVLLGGIVGCIYTWHAPKAYRGNATFFVPSQQSSGAQGYSQLLGLSGGGGSFDTYILAFFKSNQMKKAVSADLVRQFNAMKSEDLLNGLNLSSAAMLVKDPDTGMYKLSYENGDRALIPLVLGSYIKNINLMNIRYEVVPQKQVIQVLDPPLVESRPSQPNWFKNCAISIAIGFCIGIIVSLVFEKIRSLK